MSSTMGMTSLKDALLKWEEDNEIPLDQAKEVHLQFRMPPIKKLDNSLNMIPNCEKLSLSTNGISKITDVKALKCLKILSLGRNHLKNFAGLEPLRDSLEELWVSNNNIVDMTGVGVLKKMKILYMANNDVRDWSEFNKLKDCTNLINLKFFGNPLAEKEKQIWRSECSKRLPNLKTLDNTPLLKEES